MSQKKNPTLLDHQRGTTHLSISPFNRLAEQTPEAMVLSSVTYERQPVSRTVIKPGNRNHNVGLFASRRNQAMVTYESSLEKHTCMLMETWPQILSYRAQPDAYTLYFDGKFHDVVPDFLLTTETGKVIVDVKPKQKAQTRKFLDRAEAFGFFADQRDMSYTVMTEDEINGRHLMNASWLITLARGEAHESLQAAVWQWILELPDLTFGDALTMTSGYPAVRCVIAQLILDGRFEVDWELPIQNQFVTPKVLVN